MILCVSKVKLVLLIRRSRVKWRHWIGVLHLGVHGIHFLAGHILAVSSGHSSSFSALMVSACASRRVIWNAVGARMIRHITLMFWIILWMRGRVMHMWLRTTHHVRVTRMIVMRYTVVSLVSMGNIVLTLHNMIWMISITIILLLRTVRTCVVHLGNLLILIRLFFAHSWCALDPITTILAIFGI